MIHDSYFCNSLKSFGFRPWPTQRLITENVTENVPNYVGSSGDSISDICPEECRPSDHIDWELC